MPSEWTKTNGIYEIPKTREDKKGWSQSPQAIGVVVTSTGIADCVIRIQPVPCPGRSTTNNRNNTIKLVGGVASATDELVAAIIGNFRQGNTCDLIYIRVEIVDKGKDELICAKKILVHLGE